MAAFYGFQVVPEHFFMIFSAFKYFQMLFHANYRAIQCRGGGGGARGQNHPPPTPPAPRHPRPRGIVLHDDSHYKA